MDSKTLNAILNAWPEGTVGHMDEEQVIQLLDRIGTRFGYGRLQQLGTSLFRIQCDGRPEGDIEFKRERFRLMGWELPSGFPSE